jgi:hypothetical protein
VSDTKTASHIGIFIQGMCATRIAQHHRSDGTTDAGNSLKTALGFIFSSFGLTLVVSPCILS